METEKPELDASQKIKNKMHDGCKTTKAFGVASKIE